MEYERLKEEELVKREEELVEREEELVEREEELVEREEAKEEKKNKCGCFTVLLLKMKVKSFFQKRRKTNLKKKKSWSWKTWLKLGVVLGMIVTIILLLTLFNAQVKKVLVDFFSFVQSVGMWGPLCVSLFYIPATVLFFPGSIITLGAGFAFAKFHPFLVWPVLSVSIGSTLGCCLAFLIGTF